MGKSAQAFRTISEAAAELELPQHVLRFWETRFSQIKPLKRGGGRRYYRPEDVSLLKGIQYLLYDKGFTIKGVQRILKDKGSRHVISIGEAGGLAPEDAAQTESRTVGAPLKRKNQPVTAFAGAENPKISSKGRAKLSKVMRELLECKRLLDNARES